MQLRLILPLAGAVALLSALAFVAFGLAREQEPPRATQTASSDFGSAGEEALAQATQTASSDFGSAGEQEPPQAALTATFALG